MLESGGGCWHHLEDVLGEGESFVFLAKTWHDRGQFRFANLAFHFVRIQIFQTRSLGALRPPTSSLRSFGSLDFILCSRSGCVTPDTSLSFHVMSSQWSGTCLAAPAPASPADSCSLRLHRFNNCQPFTSIIIRPFLHCFQDFSLLSSIISNFCQHHDNDHRDNDYHNNDHHDNDDDHHDLHNDHDDNHDDKISLATGGVLLFHFASLPSNKKNLITRSDENCDDSWKN